MSLLLRRYQRGYVYKTGKNQKVWYGMWREDVRKPDGQIVRRQRNVRLGTLAELPTKNAAEIKLLGLLTSPGPTVEMTFSELARHWQHVTFRNLKATTADYYAKVLRAYLVPFFGRRTIATITRNEVQEFLVEQSNHYSRSSIHGMKIAFSLVMGHAVENEWLKKNPACHIKSPREEYCGGKRIVRNKQLTGAEVNAIAERLNEPYSTLVWFLSVTGLRIGEAVAIKWSDFKGNVLHVQRRVYEGAVDTPKSKKSERLLPIPEELLQRLKSLGTKDWVFQARNGSPLNQSNILRRYLRPAVKALGITLGGWHDFRHSQSTVMRQGDVPLEVRAAILGHSVKQTEDYGEVNMAEFQHPLAHVADQLLRNVTKTTRVA
jgi:integrase